jgi:alkylation response protein AidB-like acyl-CoA dehydrogenase
MASIPAHSHLTAFDPIDRRQLLEAVHEVIPQISARAAATEAAREVPRDNVECLRKAGLFRMVQPTYFGGFEQDFDLLAEAIQDIATGCASTAWVCGLQAAHQWLVASFCVEAQHDVWDATPDALVCGSYAPAARAMVVDGGYRLTGRWAFASGCDTSEWAVCAALIPSAQLEEPAKPAFLLVPASDYRIDDDWQVIGLAGTGSKSLVLEDVFVPAHRLLYFASTTSGDTPGRRHYSHNPTFGVPMLANIASCLASVSVGAAAGALAQFIDATAQRTTRGAVAGGQNRMAEFPTIQLRVAEAAAAVDAAREILLRDLRRRAATMREGGKVSVEERIESRRGQAFAVKLAVQASEALNAATGGLGLKLSNPVQRAWRDTNAVARHISFNWDAVGTMCGQLALGLEPKGQY